MRWVFFLFTPYWKVVFETRTGSKCHYLWIKIDQCFELTDVAEPLNQKAVHEKNPPTHNHI